MQALRGVDHNCSWYCVIKIEPLNWRSDTHTYIHKVIEHIYMLFIGRGMIQKQAYTFIPTLLGSDLRILDHLWSPNDVVMSWMRLTHTSNCFPHSYMTYTKCVLPYL